MVWRGVPSSNGGYNIYSGTCWDWFIWDSNIYLSSLYFIIIIL
jgi:hypothetical protein